MKISIVISVLDSHEVLRRQLVYLEKIGLPKDTEIIIADDGSVPELTYNGPLPVTIIKTHDFSGERKWTASIARNRGAKIARGEYLLMFDLDHVITRDCLNTVYEFGGDKVSFKREFGVLTEDGDLIQDLDLLLSYGFPMDRYKSRGFQISPHPNMFAMKRDIFWKLGGYNEKVVLTRTYPQGEDGLLKGAWLEWERKTGAKVHEYRPIIYMFPCGRLCGHVDYDKFGLFHKMSRVNEKNPYCRA